MLQWLPFIITALINVLGQLGARDWVAQHHEMALGLESLLMLINAVLPSPVMRTASGAPINVKPGLYLLLLLSLLPMACTPAYALDAVWDRNSEADMSHYNVYVCKSPRCTVPDEANGSLWVGRVEQPAVGQVPFWKLPDNVDGGVAVNAVDQNGNFSNVSPTLFFSSIVADTLPPGVPKNLRLR